MSCLECGKTSYGFVGALCDDCRIDNHAECRQLTSNVVENIIDLNKTAGAGR